MRKGLNHKVSPIYYLGKKIIRISDLPNDQVYLFSGWVQPDALVHISDTYANDCVHYEDYEYWFQNYFIAEKDLNYLI